MKKILIGILCMALLLSGCGKSKTTESMSNIFGSSFSEVKDAFGWKMDEADKRVITDEEVMLEERLHGFTVELTDVELLGKKASKVYLQFLGETEEDAVLTLICAEYAAREDTDVVAENLTKVWGEPREEMYWCLPGLRYWSGIWNGGQDFYSVDYFQQKASEEKMLWGSKETIEDALKDAEDVEKAYQSWGPKCPTHLFSIQSGWEVVKEEPLVTAVLFRNSEDYEKQNVLFIEGLNLYMSEYGK